MRHPIITICLMVMASAACAYGAELLVPSQFPTIQLAINAAAPGDTVILADGTYTGIGNYNIFIDKPITIRSVSNPESCIIGCNNGYGEHYQGFIMNNGILAGLTITGGKTAVTCNGGNVKLINCILTKNIGLRGAAIDAMSCHLEILNCSLTGNRVTMIPSPPRCMGGAIYCENCFVLIENSTISGNSAKSGGGIYCASYGNVTIKNCVICDNNATDPPALSGGGGVFCERGSLTVIGSEISRNSSPLGAGINCIEATSVFVSDCNIHHNVSEDLHGGPTSGGGIYYKSTATSMFSTSFSILNTFITDNIVKGNNCKGAGLYIETPMSPVSSPQKVNVMLSGCVIARNSAPSGPNPGGVGGGLYCKGTVHISETAVLNNSSSQGSGIYNDGPCLTINKCKISNNSSAEGGAITSHAGETIIQNTLLSGNKRFGCGYASAIVCDIDASLEMINTTIVGNIPPSLWLSYRTNPTHKIKNSIIYKNCPYLNKLCMEQIVPSTISISYSDIEGGYPGTGNIDADPCFMQLGHWDTNGTPLLQDDFWGDGYYRLKADSPCIDTGGVEFLMDNKDLAGNPRITGAGLDMGAYEYQNSSPIADAGPEQVVYAWIDGIAAVTLDGSASHDPDGDELSHLWSWSIDGNNFEANGVNPAIELPVGQHRIELIVNDGLVDSQPDDVNVTVIGPVEARMWTVPRVINRQGWQPYILTMLKLPEGITKEQIDPNDKLLLYPGGIEAIKQHISQVSIAGHKQIGITACFDKASLLAGINGNGPVQINVVGQLTTGQYFFGQDKIWIIEPRPDPKFNLPVK